MLLLVKFRRRNLGDDETEQNVSWLVEESAWWLKLT